MDRVLKSTATVASVSFYEDGVIVDPGTVTVTVTRDDGTALITAGATSGSGAAARTVALTTTHTALLDRLKLAWTSATKGTLTTYIEIVGGFHFTIADARQRKPLDDPVTYTAAEIAAARTYAEDELERECGMAFVPRYARDTVDGNGTTLLVLPRAGVRSIRSVSLTGTAYTAGQLTDLIVRPGGAIYNPSGWTGGTGNLIVAYEHGLDFAPPGCTDAAIVLAKHQLVQGPIDERAIQTATEFGPISLSTPGLRGSRFGIPVVDAFCNANRIPLVA